MSLRAYVPTCDAIHYLRLLGADCSKFGMFYYVNIIQYYTVTEEDDYLHYNFAEKNKFKENRAAALVEDANNDEIGTED